MVEYPAHRIALAYGSLTGKHKKDRAIVITVQVLVAFLLLPVFLAAWLLIVTWNIMYTVFHSFFTLPRAKWKDFQSRTQDQVEHKEKMEYEAAEKRKEQEAAREDTPKDADRAIIQEDKETKKKKLRRKPSGDAFQEKLRQDRKKEEEQLRQQVALLINPKQLYKSKIEGVISRRKEKAGMSNLSEEKAATSLLESHEGNHASASPATPPQEQTSIISTIMSVFRHQNDKAAASKEAV